MKKVFLFLAFFGAFAMANLSAQSCCQKGAAASGEKSCCKGEAGKACAMTKMASAAKADPTIEARLDPNGSTYYVRKEADNAGKVRLVDVKFDETTAKFVNVSPNQAAAAAANTSGLVKKEAACTSEQKAGCAKEGKAGGCCAGKKSASKE